MNAGEVLQKYKHDLEDRDAQVLLAHILRRPRTWLLAHLETPLTALQIDSAQKAFARLTAGEPLPYILGHWEFFGLDFNVTKDVLIPRPETELLVEKALSWLTSRPEARSVADIGTGSGAIAISIAMRIPDAKILATDISPAALEVAKRNAEKFNVQNQITFIECDLLPVQSQIPFGHDVANRKSQIVNRKLKVDLLCANLPYIPTDSLRKLPVFGREPVIALDGGPDGLDLYRRLFHLAPDWLAPHGLMLFEIESTLGVRALGLAFDSFSNATIHLRQDLAGNDRLLEIVPAPD